MKTIRLTLDSEVPAWARRKAAEEGLGLSRFLQKILEREIRYQSAKEAFFARELRPLKLSGNFYPRREELYFRGWAAVARKNVF